jgi:hypothetical protein
METQQCIKILPPDKTHNQARRCGCNTSLQDLEQAKRLTSKLIGQTGEEKVDIVRRIIVLRVCKNSHRKTLDVTSQLGPFGSLIEAYRESHVTTDTSELQFAESDEELFERYNPTGRGSTVSDILPMKITKEQHEQGWIYIFNWPRAPGFLKIGYARASAEQRMNAWQLCHPEAKPLYKVERAFPERMETLVHAELAGKRYRLPKDCSRCGRRHTEWFAVTLEEAQRVMMDWRKIAASPLYVEDRTLSRQRARSIGSLSQVTASILSQHLKDNLSSDMSRSCRVSEQPQTSSPRSSSQREYFVPYPSSALQIQEDRQIDGLAAKLGDLTVQSTARQSNTLSGRA